MQLPMEVKWEVRLELTMTVTNVVDRRPACEAIDVVFREPFPKDNWDSGVGIKAIHVIDAVKGLAVKQVADQLGVEPAQLKAIRPVQGYGNTIVVVAARGLKLPVPAQPRLLDVTAAIPAG